MNKLPSLTALSYLTALVESVDELYYELIRADNGSVLNPWDDESKEKAIKIIKQFLHQVILETVEVVGEEIIGKGLPEYMAGSPESYRAELRREQRLRLSQLVTTTMDSLKEKK